MIRQLIEALGSGENLKTVLIAFLLSVPVFLFSLSFHEFSHAFVANKLGDPTAKDLGRLTLDPRAHLSLAGTLMMLFIGVGWAKPVPIDPHNFKKPKRGMAVASLAGPLSNLLLSFLAFLLLGIMTLFLPRVFAGEDQTVDTLFGAVAMMLLTLHTVNLYLFLFNFLPVPPLDGSRILYAFLPSKWYFGVMKYEKVILIAVILLFYTGLLSGPLSIAVEWISRGMAALLTPLFPYLTIFI